VSNAQTQSNIATANYEAQLNRVNQNTPFGSSIWNGTGPGATQTVTLNPLAQQDLTNQLQQDVNLSNLGFGLTNQAGSSLAQPLNTSGLPALSGGPGSTGQVQGSLDYSHAPTVPTDFNSAVNQAQNAVYNQATSRLDPQWSQAQEGLNAQLANQGVNPGSQAYQTAQDNFQRQKTDAYNQANYSAVSAGDALQNQLYNQALAGRQEGVNEANTQGNFANAAQEQQYAQALQNAQFGNQARAQGLTEDTTLRSLPLNELNALRSQSQVQTPQFSQVPQTQVQPTNVSGNIWQAYNAQTANANNFMNGLFGIGGALLSTPAAGAAIFSDLRLKKNLKRIGTALSGIGIYEFEYLWSKARHIGLVAQDVLKVRPEAVKVQAGYLTVDYGMVG
jgi:hypothetical protein